MIDNQINLDGKSLLITGGTGSFGRHFVQTVLEKFKLKRLVVFSRDELKQSEMQEQLRAHEHECLRFFIGDVRDQRRLEMAFRNIDYVVHAAALKQIPAAEYNPIECVHTNVMGAENVVQAAIRTGVKQVISLSTDKAVGPINLYGATKLAADKICIAANHLSGANGTRFSIVRYGNVAGSRGSVIPLFARLIREGADSLPITDKRMTRFWITLQQGVDFVLSSLAMMRAGEIFVPKLPSLKLVDLANSMAPQLPHRIVGIRPGEKIHESLLTEDDSHTTLEISDRYIVEPVFAEWPRRSYLDDGAKRIEKAFNYSSATNSQWLDSEELEELLKNSTVRQQ